MVRSNSIVCSVRSGGRPRIKLCHRPCLGAGEMEILFWGEHMYCLSWNTLAVCLSESVLIISFRWKPHCARITCILPGFEMIVAVSFFQNSTFHPCYLALQGMDGVSSLSFSNLIEPVCWEVILTCFINYTIDWMAWSHSEFAFKAPKHHINLICYLERPTL